MNSRADSAATSAGERRVHLLRGEAHFVVTPVPKRPFSVVAGSGAVLAVGTAFDVYLKDDVVEVSVTDHGPTHRTAHGANHADARAE